MESILTSVKKLLGLEADYTQFDDDIIIHTNMALMSLTQIGIGPDGGFAISDDATTWTDFIGDRKDINGIKTYIFLKVRLVFDPPQNSFLIESINKQITELEWRLSVQTNKMEENDQEGEYLGEY